MSNIIDFNSFKKEKEVKEADKKFEKTFFNGIMSTLRKLDLITIVNGEEKYDLLDYFTVLYLFIPKSSRIDWYNEVFKKTDFSKEYSIGDVIGNSKKDVFNHLHDIYKGD